MGCSGKKLSIVDSTIGKLRSVELFVMVIGTVDLACAEAACSQRLGDLVASTMRGLEFFGSIPKVLVPDQLRSAVTGPDRCDSVRF